MSGNGKMEVVVVAGQVVYILVIITIALCTVLKPRCPIVRRFLLFAAWGSCREKPFAERDSGEKQHFRFVLSQMVT